MKKREIMSEVDRLGGEVRELHNHLTRFFKLYCQEMRGIGILREGERDRLELLMDMTREERGVTKEQDICKCGHIRRFHVDRYIGMAHSAECTSADCTCKKFERDVLQEQERKMSLGLPRPGHPYG